MAFRSDPVALRTVDDERGFELTSDGGGAEGGHRFRISGRDISIGFSARARSEPIEPSVPVTDPRMNRIVWTVNWYGADDPMSDNSVLRTLMAEALTAYKSVAGHPSWAQVRVEFGSQTGDP